MKYGLGPLIEQSSNILILGSFPGPLSLKKREYYAHPQNQFWQLLANVLGQDCVLDNYKKKKALLAKFGIGLWDMVASCERSGAYDGNIKNLWQKYRIKIQRLLLTTKGTLESRNSKRF